MLAVREILGRVRPAESNPAITGPPAAGRRSVGVSRPFKAEPEETEKRPYDAPWVIIPPTVLGDARLSAGEKLVYGRVFGFMEKFGYCRGSNEYLGKYISMSKNTVRNYLSRLYELGYLRYELLKDERGEVIERRIYPTLVLPAVLPHTSPRTPEGTKEITRRKKVNVDIENARIQYYAQLLADTLGDQKSIPFYMNACRRYDPHELVRKAKEIVADGGARKPGAVFAAWLARKTVNPVNSL
jgi:hypothetical protein